MDGSQGLRSWKRNEVLIRQSASVTHTNYVEVSDGGHADFVDLRFVWWVAGWLLLGGFIFLPFLRSALSFLCFSLRDML